MAKATLVAECYLRLYEGVKGSQHVPLHCPPTAVDLNLRMRIKPPIG